MTMGKGENLKLVSLVLFKIVYGADK